MRLLILLSFIGLIWAVAALPAAKDAKMEPNSLSDVADLGASHSNGAERQVRHWGWGPHWGGGGWGYPRYGGWGGYGGYGGWGGGWYGR
uniref:Uncharacterized protein n=1 Tax=Stomoxys calcitrans TaxID=35570 RepID=A0A1I8NXR7_STOCA|nr:unnamed protein product [Stomoxys calcitrans]